MDAAALSRIRNDVAAWLETRRVSGAPFGAFTLCSHAHATGGELNASTGALELSVMLDLLLSSEERQSAVQYLKGFQNRETGLVTDPSWAGRELRPDRRVKDGGDTFFTMTASAALRALGASFDYPVQYLAAMSTDELVARVRMDTGAHNPLAVGDLGELLYLNRELGVPGSGEQWDALMEHIARTQDPATGLWPSGGTSRPYTPHINRSFHVMRTTWNLIKRPYPKADRIIEACLEASRDTAFYDWEHGYACNDLDLAHMFYSASRWTDYRFGEVSEWARSRLPMILSVQKDDGGFSFYHEAAMRDHAGIAMSPGEHESDTWGTLMYMGTIIMMVELGYPGLEVPWGYSRVHCVG